MSGTEKEWDCFSFFSSRIESVPDLIEDSRRVNKNVGRMRKLPAVEDRRLIDNKEFNLRWWAVAADIPTVTTEVVGLPRIASYTRECAKQYTQEADEAEKEGRRSPCPCSIL